MSVTSTQSLSQYLMEGRLDNAHNLSCLLKAIHFKDTATVFLSENGMKVTVEDCKCVQANAFVQAALFSTYSLQPEQISFRINLSVLVDCLNIFGSSGSSTSSTVPALRICYAGYGSPLSLLLEEGSVVTDCSLKTQDADEALDFCFSSHNVVNKIIMKAECLREAFAELDMSSDVLEVLTSPEKPFLRLSTFGNAGDSHWECIKDSEIVECFQCNQTQVNRYKVALLKPSVKALSIASRVSIRTDHRGFLSLQYMVRLEHGQTCFLEYFCAPDEEQEEEELGR